MPKRRLLQAREVAWTSPPVGIAGRGSTGGTAGTTQTAGWGTQMMASAVIVIPLGTMTANNAQRALEDLADGKLALGGGTMTGALLLWADPTADSEAATKHYVDQVVQGLDVRNAANVTILRASSADNIAEFGPSTVPHIEYDGAQVLIAGTPIAPILRASATWNPANISDGAVASTIITVTGAEVGDVVIAAHDQITTEEVLVSAHVRAADTVLVVIHNKTGSDLNIDSGTLYVTVFKRP